MRKHIQKRAFTLVEIMIVVLIIGILLAIAVPNFVKARENARVKTCIAQLKRIEASKEQWAMEFKKSATDTPAQGDLVPDYIKGWVECPGGGSYTINNVGTKPTCSLGGTHVIP
ncbi:MAG: prepilin-type N-terminal cleavage/methylation domain-containing protein [Fimbriimonadaceae bacterium]